MDNNLIKIADKIILENDQSEDLINLYKSLRLGYIDKGNYYLIPLTQNQWSLIDKADWDLINKTKWFAIKDAKGFYARGKINGKTVALHRYLLNPQNEIVDHINRNTLDNRRSNLRLVTPSQSSKNRAGWRNKKRRF